MTTPTGVDLPEALKVKLSGSSLKVRKIWESYYAKYQQSSDETDFALNDIPGCVPEKNKSFSNHVQRNKLTDEEEELVNLIELDLKSTFNELLLKREQTKLLLERDAYFKAHANLKTEIKRLKKFLSEKQLETYVILSVRNRPEIVHFIEEVKKSKFKDYLLLRFEAMESDEKHAEAQKWHIKVLTEWKYLIKLVSQEDVIIYAVNILKEL